MSTIFVVEDDADTRELLSDVLRLEGHDVITAEDGLHALHLLRMPHVPRPAVILLDVQMPRLDGKGFLVEQQGDPALADIPVVITSATSQLRTQSTLGAADFLPKPFVTADLLAVVARFCAAPAARAAGA